MTCTDKFADANRARIAYVKEENFCEFPNPADLQVLRITSSDLAAEKDTSPSDEIRSDRQVSDLAELGWTTGGSIGFEKSLTTFDELLEGALCNPWVIGLNINAPFDIVTGAPATGQVTITDAGANGLFVGLVVGQQVFISDGTNYGWFEISVVVSVDEISVFDPVGILSDGTNIYLTINGDSLVNGVEKISYAIEQAFLDAAFYMLFHGQRVGTWSLSIESQSKITGSFGFQGTELETAGTEYGDSYLPATTTPIVNATSNVGFVLVNGQVLETCIQSISLELDNALRVQAGVGSKWPCGIGLGRQQITGNFTAYFVNGTLYNAFLQHSNASLIIPIADTEGNQFLIELPKIKFSTDSPAPSGIDTDIMDEMDFQAIVDAELGYSIKLTRASVPGLILKTSGTESSPAQIALYGNYLAGTTFNVLIKTPLNPAGNEAPFTLIADASSEEAAQLWGDFIKGINEVTTTMQKNVINILPFAPGVSIDSVELLEIVPA